MSINKSRFISRLIRYKLKPIRFVYIWIVEVLLQLVLNYGYRFVVSVNCVITQSEKLITYCLYVLNRSYQIFDHLIGHNLKTFYSHILL